MTIDELRARIVKDMIFRVPYESPEPDPIVEAALLAALDCVEQARNVSLRAYDAAGVLKEKLDAFDVTLAGDKPAAPLDLYNETKAALASPAPSPVARDARCTCAAIQAADASRHFRECPMREVYPEPVAAIALSEHDAAKETK